MILYASSGPTLHETFSNEQDTLRSISALHVAPPTQDNIVCDHQRFGSPSPSLRRLLAVQPPFRMANFT
ncbi:hypothetical protein RJ55_04779 [Drechmeria coniospora]|nr:hypothetical protein RJ55_04779 [Drechmeria coniospora]